MDRVGEGRRRKKIELCDVLVQNEFPCSKLTLLTTSEREHEMSREKIDFEG